MSPRRTIALAALLLAAGCQSYHEVAVDDLTTAIEPGEIARVTLQSGEVVTFVVHSVSSQRISSARHDYAPKDIRTIERKRPTGGGGLLVIPVYCR